ncbi:MAG TPA: histidine--tRNA ligase [Candidatus Aquilonibacter sp.]|nr:histidine--tRNA ligase [Candidatus Aquilonibacter sp.]
MSEKRQFRAIKGTRDILPPDSGLWNWFERTAREVFETYGFGEIRLPIFEETELFARAVGADTDIVTKEMFTFEDRPGELPSPREDVLADDYFGTLEDLRTRGDLPDSEANRRIFSKLQELLAQKSAAHEQVGRGPTPWDREIVDRYNKLAVQFAYLIYTIELGDLLTLRPEATAGVARAYIEHGMHTLPGNVKLYYAGPMFRRERPQKGRYRQFYQVGAEILGQSDAPAIDAEVLEMLMVLFRRVGLTNTRLYVNSIGCKECRPRYVELLREELRKVRDKLGADSQRRIDTNPLRVLDSKLPDEQPIIETLPRISEHLCEACREHFAKLKDELKLRGIDYEENWRLVRGLDYYTRTTFEVTAAGLGSQNAVCGGGRYDGLVELLGGPPTKGIGFAIGTDRAILSIQEGSAPKLPGLGVYVAWMGAATYPTAVAIARKLRDGGVAVELPPEEMKFKKSLGLADKLGARYALIIGEDEVASGTYTLKRLADAEQKKLGENELLEYLESERRS